MNLQKQEILDKAKEFFKSKVITNHHKQVAKLGNLAQFTPNPFLAKYLARFAFGKEDSISIAKALIYPRVLGTSITTIFGTAMQSFCTDVLNGFASVVQGIDIEFDDKIDGRHKYCQIKSGPQTINKDDIKTILDHFDSIRRLARVNGLKDFNPDTDCVVGVFYGEKDELSAMYHAIDAKHPVYAGKDFWHRLTGDENFYQDLINCIVDAAADINDADFLNDIINQLARDIENKNH